MWWVSGGLWLGVLLVWGWLLGRSSDEPSDLEDHWYIAWLVSTVAWGATLAWKGAWGWAMASVVVAAIWISLWTAVANYTDPHPAWDWEDGGGEIVVYMLVFNGVLFGLGAGLGAGAGALYRRLRARGVPRA